MQAFGRNQILLEPRTGGMVSGGHVALPAFIEMD